VYATLAELHEVGLIGSVGNPEPVRYEVNLDAHDHFRCRLCLRLFDVDVGGQTLLTNAKLSGFHREDITVVVEGVCAECRAYQSGLTDGAAAIQTHPLLDSDAISVLACTEVHSPLGDIALAASKEGIVRLAFDGHADFTDLVARAATGNGPKHAKDRLTELSAHLERYFEGSQDAFPDLIDWQLLTALQSESLGSTALIPYGDVRSYEAIRDELTPQQCGLLMGANPVPVLTPCHRVSCGTYRPTVWVGGSDRLKTLRALER
jgi:methylated-DNA-[protein]-cysteine S-methyltransferase